MKKLGIFLSTVLLAIAFSCNDSNLTEKNEIKIDEKGIETLINYIDFNVDYLASINFKDYDNAELTAKIIADNNIAFEKQYGVSIASNSSNARVSTEQQSYVTSMDAEVSQKLTEFAKNSADQNDYLSKLSDLKTEIYSYNASLSEKQILINRIVFIERLVGYMEAKAVVAESKKPSVSNPNAKVDPKNPPAKDCGWWCSWGKCAASIVGGSMTGGAAGCAAVGGLGAMIGTAVAGAPGTAAGGIGGCVAGGIVGFIGGGLTGAVLAC